MLLPAGSLPPASQNAGDTAGSYLLDPTGSRKNMGTYVSNGVRVSRDSTAPGPADLLVTTCSIARAQWGCERVSWREQIDQRDQK
mgnify:CR=1 FL=1